MDNLITKIKSSQPILASVDKGSGSNHKSSDRIDQ